MIDEKLKLGNCILILEPRRNHEAVRVVVRAENLGFREAVLSRPVLDLLSRMTVGDLFIAVGAWTGASTADCVGAVDLGTPEKEPT